LPLLLSPCSGYVPSFRRDWLVDPATRDVPSFTAIDLVSSTTRLIVSSPRVLAVRNAADQAIDLTAALSPHLLTVLSNATSRFLSPVELGSRGRVPGAALQFVAVPRNFNADTSIPMTFVSFAGQLSDVTEVAPTARVELGLEGLADHATIPTVARY